MQDGRTALSLAAERGYIRIIERLITAESDICAVDKVRECIIDGVAVV